METRKKKESVTSELRGHWNSPKLSNILLFLQIQNANEMHDH